MATNARGTHAPPIDRDLLHRLLHRRADHWGRIRFSTKDLAAELDIGYCNLSTIVNDMAEQGRLRRLSGQRYQQATYQVIDPDVWRARSA